MGGGVGAWATRGPCACERVCGREGRVQGPGGGGSREPQRGVGPEPQRGAEGRLHEWTSPPRGLGAGRGRGSSRRRSADVWGSARADVLNLAQRGKGVKPPLLPSPSPPFALRGAGPSGGAQDRGRRDARGGARRRRRPGRGGAEAPGAAEGARGPPQGPACARGADRDWTGTARTWGVGGTLRPKNLAPCPRRSRAPPLAPTPSHSTGRPLYSFRGSGLRVSCEA